MDGLFHTSDISCPHEIIVAVNDEIEAGIAEVISRGRNGEGPVGMNFRSHHHDGIAVGQRKDDLDAGRGMAGNRADGVAARVKNIACGIQLSYPGSLDQLPCLRVAHLKDAAGHAASAVEGGQRNIQLLKTATEDDGQRVSEGTEETMPLGPGIERVVGGLLVERSHRRCDLAEVSLVAG